MRKYRLIGLTGQSGAGKTAVSQTLAACGASVISADAIVAQLYVEHSPCVTTIAAVFGSDCVASDGSVNRKILAQRAFSSAENTALLGKIVHPFVTARLFELLKGMEGIIIYDAPQLFEAGADVICDGVLAVVADEATRLARIIRRDGLTEAQAMARVNAQLGEEFFRAHADWIIENNSGKKMLEQSAVEFYHQLQKG